jgi:hypothetical protein
MEVSVLGFGGSEIGYGEVAQAEVNALLTAAIEAGLNVIDTAECYPNSEVKIGEAIQGLRDDVFIFTKCGHADSEDDLKDWDPKLLARQIDRSLSRLKTDRVDLIQLHTCSEDLLRQGEVVDVLRRAKEAGKARYIGYSGDNASARFAVECGAFDAWQCSINIADQDAVSATLPLAQAANMGVIAKRPVANAAWLSGNVPPASNYSKPYWERLNELAYKFLHDPKHSISTALRFTLAQPGVHVAIVGTTKPGRWEENAHLIEEPLDPAMVLEIRDRWSEVASDDWVGLS